MDLTFRRGKNITALCISTLIQIKPTYQRQTLYSRKTSNCTTKPPTKRYTRDCCCFLSIGLTGNNCALFISLHIVCVVKLSPKQCVCNCYCFVLFTKTNKSFISGSGSIIYFICLTVKSQPLTLPAKMYEIEIRDIIVKFPFVPNAIQRDFVSNVIECLNKSENAVLKSPTGLIRHDIQFTAVLSF